MSEPFLSSDDYDERAHQLYNEAHYDAALEVLREGLGLYPHTVELHVGMGTRAWPARSTCGRVARSRKRSDSTRTTRTPSRAWARCSSSSARAPLRWRASTASWPSASVTIMI